MAERTKALKFKKNGATVERVQFLRERFEDECKAQFIAWAEGTSLDIAGMWSGDPVYRPAICAWEAWKAAWEHLSSNVEVRGARRTSDSNVGLDDEVRYWLCCGSKEPRHGAESCYEAQMGHPERVRFGTSKEHSEWQREKSSNV